MPDFQLAFVETAAETPPWVSWIRAAAAAWPYGPLQQPDIDALYDMYLAGAAPGDAVAELTSRQAPDWARFWGRVAYVVAISVLALLWVALYASQVIATAQGFHE